ncbi:probable peroxidase 26 [Cynara cardunculus var. scolymus]|uniref:probable peroxidase 26 n=1 Tax=Cynara cardunculus var. scolymus TaxID=59895 RepID=UPI000D62ECD2|nr:probable peroxidase 26 [Cynara cardunculus var. scolymus]
MKRQGCVFLFFVLIFAFIGVEVTATGLPPESAPLIRQYYKVHNTCANVERFVRFQVKSFWDKDRTITPKLVKLLYADCMVNGCDASILLNGNNTEKASPKNRGLAGFAFIDIVKRVVESRCPGAVSCADILNIAVRDAIYFSGGPSYPVFLGRRDGLKSEASWVDLPSPSISWESALAYFTSKGLNVQDMVTLLGGHMMGRTRCSNVHDRLYNFKNTGKPDPSMESTTLSYLQQQCPKKVRLGQPNPLINLNPENPTHNFTNSYYKRVLANKAVLGVDQQLRYGGDTYELTDQFADSLGDLKGEFAFSMSRMGGLKVLTGTKGQIRRDCRVVNK